MASSFPAREAVIELYRASFSGDARVHALWLEGADGVGLADAYSDLDFWLDAEDDAVDAVLADAVALARTLGPLDQCHTVPHGDGKIAQANVHVAGMSPYLTLDLCVQKHSRVAEGCCAFTREDPVEGARVLFDKDGCITWTDPTPPDAAALARLRDGAVSRLAQRGRVEKYIARGLFPEARAHYEEYVLEPLILLARLIHTPDYPDYGYTHLSRHLPGELVRALEGLIGCGSLGEMPGCLAAADALAARLEKTFSEKYAR